MKAPLRTQRNTKPWRFGVEQAERLVDVDAFLRRLAEVVIAVDRDAKAAVEVASPND